MTAADRPSVTDNARAEAERRWPEAATWQSARMQVDAFVAGAEWAAGRAETTTATTEDAARAIEANRRWSRTMSDGYPSGGENTSEEIAQALADAGLLATARTRPTREAVARAICESTNPGIPAAWNAYRDQWLQDADAVLALLADQPTEAEAGARALVHAAGDHFHAMVAAGAGNPSEVSTWLRERAARLRAGDDR